MKIKEKAIKVFEALMEKKSHQVTLTHLNLAINAIIGTSDRGTIKLIRDFLTETKLLTFVSNGKIPVYKVNYERLQEVKKDNLIFIPTTPTKISKKEVAKMV